MARHSKISRKIYREHLQLYRWMNDVCIFLDFAVPQLTEAAKSIEANSEKAKYRFMVPKKGTKIVSRRRRADLAAMLDNFSRQSLLESMLVTLVSRVEAHMQECMRCVIVEFPHKLTLLCGDKGGVPLSTVLNSPDKATIIEEVADTKISELMFLSPKDYAKRFQDVISITLPEERLAAFYEIKATRDLIVHNEGVINSIYLQKAAGMARGSLGDSVLVDRKYFDRCIERCKSLAGGIMHHVEEKYG